MRKTPALLLPAALRRGDRVAVVSPCGPVRDADAFRRGLARLESWGLRPEVGPHALDALGYLAGDDAARAADLQAALEAPDVRAIFCSRGGYGATRLLGRIDFAPLLRDPKPIVGYSDATALLLAARSATGVVSFHGPMVATRDVFAFDAASEALQRALLFDPAPAGAPPSHAADPPPRALAPGAAEGPLVGGNLSLLAALAGTPYAPDTKGAILFFEDVGEDAYRVDRMLTQLLQAGWFEGAAGVAVGDLRGRGREPDAECPPGTASAPASAPEPTRDLEETVRDRLGKLRIPVAFGLPFGHRRASWTLPVGARARLDASDPARPPEVSFVGPAVRARG